MIQNRPAQDIVFIALMAAMGIGSKPVVGPLAKSIASAFFLPAGTISGSIYMIWPMMALLAIRKPGTATLVGLVEAILVITVGSYGSHGLLSLATYTVPCLVMDIAFLPYKIFGKEWLLVIPSGLANSAGTILVGRLLMHSPWSVLLIGAVIAFILGGAGGMLACALHRRLLHLNPEREN